MSRSFRSTPNYHPKLSEKDDKKEWHSRFRAVFRSAILRIKDIEEFVPPHFREVSDRWNMMKDCDGYTGYLMRRWHKNRKGFNKKLYGK